MQSDGDPSAATGTDADPVTNTYTGAEPTAAWPTAPSYNFTVPPRLMTSVDTSTLTSDISACFFRSAAWTGDATAVLATAEDRVLRVYDTPYADDQTPSFVERGVFAQPDSVNAALWYPSASALYPETFCFVASVRDTPVRLIDAVDGRIRASYPIVDHRERFIAPHSLAFNTSQTRLYCGFENAIEVLDIATPGPGNSDRLQIGLTKRERSGQKGLISALAFNPHAPGSFAAGSFSGSVMLYDEDTGARAAGHLYGVPSTGVTQLVYHPLDGNVLFVASRRSDAVLVYDLRDTSAAVARLERPGGTNQRLTCAADPWGRWLASGDEHGRVRVWDIASGGHQVLMDEQLHGDAVGSVQFHPFKPLLLTAAGSRAFLQSESDDEDESDGSSEESESEDDGVSEEMGTPPPPQQPQRSRRPPRGPKDSRMAIWSLA